MLILIGPRDAGNVGEVRAQAGEAFEFAAIAEIPTVTRAVQDDELALGLRGENRPQHGNVGREAGAGGDEHGGLAGRRAVERENAAGLGAEEHAVAVFEREESRRQSAAGDERDVKFAIAPFHAGGGDAVGAADELIRRRRGIFRFGFRHARRGAGQAEHGELAGLEFEQLVVGPHAEHDEFGMNLLASDDAGVGKFLSVGAHGISWA